MPKVPIKARKAGAVGGRSVGMSEYIFELGGRSWIGEKEGGIYVVERERGNVPKDGRVH